MNHGKQYIFKSLYFFAQILFYFTFFEREKLTGHFLIIKIEAALYFALMLENDFVFDPIKVPESSHNPPGCVLVNGRP